MNNILTNWRTTLLGGGALTAAITLFVAHPDQWQSALSMAIIGVLGILAKDAHNSETTKN